MEECIGKRKNELGKRLTAVVLINLKGPVV